MVEEQTSEQAIFEAARKLNSTEARDACLKEMCGEDENLRRRVEALLRAHDRSLTFLETPPEGVTVEPRLEEQPGTVIGPYKLLQQIGEGGMGVVFMAEQTAPIQRTVALKIIKPGMDTQQVIARFEAERQALAMMDHPNIAKVLDAGATDSGRPYFVMELVKGVPITKYCDEKQLSLRERLDLFKGVCQAVQHAHQKGIIHRDIKPTNVLVAEYDNHAVPKVIDFGVAKATAQKLTERTMFTEFGQVLGTVEYMSPEQAKLNQLDIDTRTDIYSLGVLLYELLTGSTPFERNRLRAAAFDEALRIIREEEPPKPSTKLSSSVTLPSVAANRHTEPARLSKDIRGELDWIVMKCLEKDRNRRYETANSLAADLRHYLQDEPVRACPPSAAYRFRKFARRNKAALIVTTAALATLLLLVLGLAVSNRLIAAERNAKGKALNEKEQALVVAETQRRRAEENFRNARIAVRDILIRPVLGSAGTGEWSRLPPVLRKQFADGAIKFYETLLHEGDADPSLRLETAVGYRSLSGLRERIGERDEAEKLARRSIAILEKLGSEYPDVLEYRQQLGWSYFVLAWTFRNTSRLAEAQAAFQQAASLYEGLLAQRPEEAEYRSEMVIMYSALGQAMLAGKRLTEAERAFRRSVEMFEMYQRAPATDEHTAARIAYASSCRGVADVLVRTGRTKDAGTWVARGIELDLAKRGPADQWKVQIQLANLLRGAGDIDAALAKYSEVIATKPDMAEAWVGRGACHLGKAEFAKAAEDFTAAIKLKPEERWYWHERAWAYLCLGDHKNAIADHSKAIELNDTDAGQRLRRGQSYKALGDFLKAYEDFSRAIELEPRIWEHWYHRGQLYVEHDGWDKAPADFAKAIEIKPDRWEAWSGRASVHLHRQQWEQAIADYSKAIELAPEVHTNWLHRGHAYLELARWDKAAADFSKLLEQWPHDSGAWFFLAAAHAQMNKPNDALSDLRQAIANGFNDIEHLKTYSTLDPMRSNPEFQKLVAELEEKKK